MQPIGPLMIEHRLIERLLNLMAREFKRIKDNIEVDPEFAFVDPVFIDTAVDFIRTYADRCHHGKEEDILFGPGGQRFGPGAPADHGGIDQGPCLGPGGHRQPGQGQGRLSPGKARGAGRTHGAYGKLVEFYPQHIEKEDKHFFIPCMAYFSEAEQADLLARMQEFDR